ncbi:MAG: diphthine--ammonia ligase [Acidobacteriota bacterium]|nr:diphthine--ammonia ligase [Acidobacteriota bacterium]
MKGYEMKDRKRVLMSWSGGKDSCMALHRILQEQSYAVAALLTTVTRDYERVSMHGVRRVLLEQQAEALGLTLQEIEISKGATNEEYETRLADALNSYKKDGVDTVVFGDLFLEDIRAYREQFLARLGLSPLFPVWGWDTRDFIRAFLELGFRAVATCVDPRALDESFAGRLIDRDFLEALPTGVDPCGENGEFHTFVFDGPIFKHDVKFEVGEVVLRDNFYFCDLLPQE